MGEYDEDEGGKLNRNNAELDADCLEDTMSKLYFKVTKLVGRITLEDARKAIKSLIRGKQQEGSDMIAICILTHGTQLRGEVLRFSCGNTVYFGDLTEPLMRCRELTNCPKICIIQACRGSENRSQSFLDVEDAIDCHGHERYHSAADRAVIWASPSGNKALRGSRKISYFIKYLCQKLNKYGTAGEDLDNIVRRLNHKMKHDKVHYIAVVNKRTKEISKVS